MPILGETNSTLLLTSITLDSAATYNCRASTDSSGVRSTDAVLTVKGTHVFYKTCTILFVHICIILKYIYSDTFSNTPMKVEGNNEQ